MANTSWTPDDEHSDEERDHAARGVAVSSNRAAVKLLGEVGLRKTMKVAQRVRVRRPSERAVDRARVRRGHAGRDHVGLRRVCQRRPRVSPLADSPRGRSRWHRAVRECRAAAPRDQTGDGLSDGRHAQGRDRRRHRIRRAALRLHAAGRRQDRHHQRLSRCVVCGLHAEARDRRVGRLRSAAIDSARRLCLGAGGAAVGAIHDERDQGSQAELGPAGRPAPTATSASPAPNPSKWTTALSWPPSRGGDLPARNREPPKKKRGFWSRIFGGGDKDEKDEKDEKKKGRQ